MSLKKIIILPVLFIGFSVSAAQPRSLTDAEKKQFYAHKIRNQWGKVAEVLTGMIKKNPKKAMYWEHRANAYVEQNNYNRAINDLTQALLLCGNKEDASLRGRFFLLRSIVYSHIGKFDQAISDAISAISIGESHGLAIDKSSESDVRTVNNYLYRLLGYFPALKFETAR